jgi:hypothetical protein
MASFMAIAAIALVGIVATACWIIGVALGIRRGDKASLAVTTGAAQVGSDQGRVSRLARHSTGLHWA